VSRLRAGSNCAKSLAVVARSGLAPHARMFVFAVLLGLAVPLALLAGRRVTRSRPPRDRALVGGGWACFGASFGVGIGALLLLAQGYRIAGFVGSVLGVWLAFAGIALAIEGNRRLRRPTRSHTQTLTLRGNGTFTTL
jgi:hypothetical protein